MSKVVFEKGFTTCCFALTDVGAFFLILHGRGLWTLVNTVEMFPCLFFFFGWLVVLRYEVGRSPLYIGILPTSVDMPSEEQIPNGASHLNTWTDQIILYSNSCVPISITHFTYSVVEVSLVVEKNRSVNLLFNNSNSKNELSELSQQSAQLCTHSPSSLPRK